MKLNERIKNCRCRSGLTQEQVAEALGVSRQAVTKWESGMSAPSTEKLFKLAELFGTTVDLILTDENDQKLSASEEFYLLYKADQQRRLEERKNRRINVMKMLLFIILWYVMILLSGFWLQNIGLLKDTYLFFWLISSKSCLIVFIVSLIFVFLGWDRLVLTLSLSYLIGFVAGTIFGPNPEGQTMGFGHYGWLYWIIFVLLGLIVGLLWEFIAAGKKR